MFTFEKRVLSFIKEENLIEKNDIIVLAISGGLDSSSLLRLLYDIKPKLGIARIVLAHLNHKLRGKDSDRDEEFVRGLAQYYHLPIEVSRLDIRALALLDINKKESLESVAHKYRMSFLLDVAKKYGASKIVTAHNKNDLAETVLMWLTRGTSLRGASGILPRNGKFIRPFLTVSREEIQDYANALGLNFVSDASNWDINYTRNYFRHKVLPVLKTLNSSVIGNIANFATMARLDDEYLDMIVSKVFEESVQKISDSVYFIPFETFLRTHKAITGRLVKKVVDSLINSTRGGVSFYHIQKLYELLNSGGEKEFDFPLGIRIRKDNTGIYIGRSLQSIKDINTKSNTYSIKLNIPGTLFIDEFNLKLKVDILANNSHILDKVKTTKSVMYLNYDRLSLPIFCRKAQIGDRFTPYGLKGSKKLSDYFTDKKLAPSKRWNNLVLENKDGIICILEETIDDKYKIDHKVRNVLRIEVLK